MSVGAAKGWGRAGSARLDVLPARAATNALSSAQKQNPQTGDQSAWKTSTTVIVDASGSVTAEPREGPPTARLRASGVHHLGESGLLGRYRETLKPLVP